MMMTMTAYNASKKIYIVGVHFLLSDVDLSVELRWILVLFDHV